MEYFICRKCNERKKETDFYPSNIKKNTYCCKQCILKYQRERYAKNLDVRNFYKERVRNQHESGYFEKHYRKKKLGDADVIRELCRDYGFSEDVSNAIAVDGELLDEKLNHPKR